MEECLQTLRREKDYYAEEIAWIQREWSRRMHGYWFFNNGRPTYITGVHYFYLCNWWLGSRRPEYRSRDRKFFLFAMMCLLDEFALGFNYPKFRREGATSKVSCFEYWLLTMETNVHGGNQSKDGPSAEEVFTQHIVPSHRKMPFWFSPVTSGRDNSKSSLDFFPVSKHILQSGRSTSTTASLESFIDWGPSTEGFYDRAKLRFHYNDECGKCHSKGTKVLMYNGDIKCVEDVLVGDILMGDDSTPRMVTSLARGIDDMYEVIPNKGDAFGCNKAHILSIKRGSKVKYKGFSFNDTINISIEDYLKSSNNFKQHAMLYRVGVHWKENRHSLDPYMLGVWLGDGTSRAPQISICDKEVISYLNSFCKKNKLSLRKVDDVTYHLTTGVAGSKNNALANALKKLNLIQNKHIPREYLIDSKRNRLKLLAGLIDTDGHADKNARRYEITQVRKALAEQICFLASSLGFYSSLKYKKTSMKREDGTYYIGDAYRVEIYGLTLHEIPCKVKRKKYSKIKSPHKNTRNPLRSGFKVKYVGKGDYYGFTITGNHLYLLHDFTVTHNTIEANIYSRHLKVRPALSEGNKFIGLEINTSTVGDMIIGGGENFKKLCQGSMYEDRMDNGETATGLYNLFIPAQDGYDLVDKRTGKRFIDKYGNSDVEATKKYLQGVLDSLLAKGDLEGYNEQLRMYPMQFRDSFRTSSGACKFNVEILEYVLDKYRFGNPHKVRGNFVWKDNIKDSIVEWHPSTNGKFLVSWLPEQGASNKFILVHDVKVPANRHKGIFGGDPFKLNLAKSKASTLSDGACVGFRKFDPGVDNATDDVSLWKTNKFCCTYSNRPRTKKEYGEDVLMACIYYGWELYPEINVDFLWDYFDDRGYGGYLYYKIDEKTKKRNRTPGAHTDTGVKENIYGEYLNYIEMYGRYEVHDEIFRQCREIQDDMQPYDLFVAGGYALMGVHRSESEPIKNVHIKPFHRLYNYSRSQKR